MTPDNGIYKVWFSDIVRRYYRIRKCRVPLSRYKDFGFFVTMMFDRKRVFAWKHVGGLSATDTSYEFDAFHSLYMRMAKLGEFRRIGRGPQLPLAIAGADQQGSRFRGVVDWTGDNLHIHALIFGHPACEAQTRKFADAASKLPGKEGLELVSKIEFRPFDQSKGISDYLAKSIAKTFHVPSSVEMLRIYPKPNLSQRVVYRTKHPRLSSFDRVRLAAQVDAS